MTFDKSGQTFYAYNMDLEKESISFKHKAEDSIFKDGKNMEEKMEELFQYGNDFKQSMADAIIARGGSASANMAKDELSNAILNLDTVGIKSDDGLLILLYNQYTASFAELFPDFVEEIDFNKPIIFVGTAQLRWDTTSSYNIGYCPFYFYNDPINNFYSTQYLEVLSKANSNCNFTCSKGGTMKIRSENITKDTTIRFVDNKTTTTSAVYLSYYSIIYTKKIV